MIALTQERYPRTWAALGAALGAYAISDEWPQHVWERAWGLGVGPTLLAFARARGVAVPDRVLQLERASVAAGMARRHHAQTLLRAMEMIPCVIHKGDPLAMDLYGDVRLRASGDVDLLIRLEDVERAAQVLRELGYAPLYGMERPEPLLVDEWGWRHEGTGQVVELHWALAAPHIRSPGWDAIWGGRQAIMIGGTRWQAPGGAHELLGLCYHFHHHVGHLKGLVDVASWLDRHGRGAIYGEALLCARDLGVEGIVRWPQEVIGGLLGGRVTGVLARRSVREVRGCLETDRAGVGFKIEGVSQAQVVMWQALGGLALDGWRARVGGVLHPFFYSPEVWAARRGGEEVGWRDRVMWAGRPAWMGVKQLKNVIFAYRSA